MKIQKKFLFALISTGIWMGGVAAQQSVVTSGGDISGVSGTVSYSIGQITYVPVEGEAGLIYTGVQQPYASNTVSTEDIIGGICVQVYPNPFSQGFVVQIADELADMDLNQLSLRLSGLDGRMLWQSNVMQRITPVTCEGFVEGMYVLQVIYKQYETVSLKLIKTN